MYEYVHVCVCITTRILSTSVRVFSRVLAASRKDQFVSDTSMCITKLCTFTIKKA